MRQSMLHIVYSLRGGKRGHITIPDERRVGGAVIYRIAIERFGRDRWGGRGAKSEHEHDEDSARKEGALHLIGQTILSWNESTHPSPVPPLSRDAFSNRPEALPSCRITRATRKLNTRIRVRCESVTRSAARHNKVA